MLPDPLLTSSKNPLKKLKKCFFQPENDQKTLLEGQFLTYNLDFRGHISTFRAENKAKSGHFKAENNA